MIVNLRIRGERLKNVDKKAITVEYANLTHRNFERSGGNICNGFAVK